MQGKNDRRELALLAALLLFVAGLCVQPMAESDLFFRLKVGQQILAGHALVDRNLFSFTAPEHPDLDLAWGFEVLVALLFRWGGFPAVVLGKTVIVIIAFAGAFAVCRRRGAPPWAAAVALAVAAVVMRERLVERPHIVSFLGEVAVLALLDRLRRGGAWSWRAGLAGAGALLVWANMHAGLFVGAAMLALAGVGALRNARVTAGRAFAWAGVAIAAACATPVGPGGIARYLLLHLTLPRIHTIDEFRPATLRSDAAVLIWLVVVPLLALLVSRTMRGRRLAGAAEVLPGAAPDWAEVLPVLGVAVLGVASVRFSADAALVAAPLGALVLSIVLEGALARRAALAPAAAVERVRSAVSVAVIVGLLFATLAPRVAEARAGRPFIDAAVDRSYLPLDAIRFADDNGLRDRMYNDFELGSYLLFEGYPRHRVFIDPRLPAYPEDLHRELGRFDHDRASWDALMTRYGVDSALLGYAGVNRRIAWWDPERWALIYRAGDARVFVRRSPRWRALIAKHEVPVTFDFDVWTGARAIPLLERPAASPVGDCEWQRRLGDLVFDLQGGETEAKTTEARVFYARALAVPGCLAATDEAALAAWMGALDLGHGDWRAAVAHLDRALDLAPTDTRTRANRATALERLGRRAAAAADWTQVAAAAAGTEIGTAAAARAQALAH